MTLRSLCQFAVKRGLLRDDPTRDIKQRSIKGDGFHTWTDDEIAQFEAHHPIGTKPRLALALLLYTAQRRSDVVRMGRQHIGRTAVLTVKQQKTGVDASAIPVHPALQTVLDATPSEHLTFLVTATGKPYGGNAFQRAVSQLVRRGRIAETLQGARAAQGGLSSARGSRCTANEIMGISGHTTMKEIVRYTVAADQARLARNAIDEGGHPMIRREFITLLGGAAAAWPLAARAQQPTNAGDRVPEWRIALADIYVAAFRDRPEAIRGYIEGRTWRLSFAGRRPSSISLPRLAAESVERKVGVYCHASDGAGIAANTATSVIPMVFLHCGDPVGARSGGEFQSAGRQRYGLSMLTTAIAAKRIELLRETLPTMQRLGHAVEPKYFPAQSPNGRRAAGRGRIGQATRIATAWIKPRSEDICRSEAPSDADALLVAGDPSLTPAGPDHRARRALRLPTIYI